MSTETPNHQPPETIDEYVVSGTRYGTAETLKFWHIFSHHKNKGVAQELIVEGENFKPAQSSAFENGSVSVRATGTRANITADQQAAILKAIANWERLRKPSN